METFKRIAIAIVALVIIAPIGGIILTLGSGGASAPKPAQTKALQPVEIETGVTVSMWELTRVNTDKGEFFSAIRKLAGFGSQSGATEWGFKKVVPGVSVNFVVACPTRDGCKEAEQFGVELQYVKGRPERPETYTDLRKKENPHFGEVLAVKAGTKFGNAVQKGDFWAMQNAVAVPKGAVLRYAGKETLRGMDENLIPVYITEGQLAKSGSLSYVLYDDLQSPPDWITNPETGAQEADRLAFWEELFGYGKIAAIVIAAVVMLVIRFFVPIGKQFPTVFAILVGVLPGTLIALFFDLFTGVMIGAVTAVPTWAIPFLTREQTQQGYTETKKRREGYQANQATKTQAEFAETKKKRAAYDAAQEARAAQASRDVGITPHLKGSLTKKIPLIGLGGKTEEF